LRGTHLRELNDIRGDCYKMFWLFFALKLFGCCLLGAIASLFMLQVVYVAAYTIALMKFISKNNRLPEHLSNISVDSCTKSEQREKRANVANYTYAIKHCIRKTYSFVDIFSIIRIGSYHPSEVESLSEYQNSRGKQNEENLTVGIIDSPFPNKIDEVLHSGTNVSQGGSACQPKGNDTENRVVG